MANWLSSLWRRGSGVQPAASADYSTIDTPAGLESAFSGGETAAGAPVSASSAMRVAAVYRCVDLRATALACLPIHVYAEQAGGGVGKKVSDHPLAILLGKRPNRRHTGFEFRRLLSVHVLLRGNAYALKVWSRGRVVELLPMHPDRVRVEELADQSLRYTYTRANGGQAVFSEEDVFHLRDLSTDGIVGLSRITMMREAVGMAVQAERFGARMFKNGIGAGGAIKHPNSIGDVAYGRLKADMSERYSGADNAHKWMILEEGMDVAKLGLTSEDMQFIESRKFQRSEIAMFFGVPPHLIGDVEKTTSWGTGIEQQNLGFLQYTLGGDIAMWEQRIERDLIPDSEPAKIYVKLNVSGFLRAASKDRAEYLSRALGSGGQQAWMTPNEARALEDLPPVPDGDKLPQPMGASAPPPKPAPAPAPEEVIA
ncbi:MAG: phage portal protein [Rubritepida sp.]|nr:phage portal protein [Rubritepida sp.]